MYVFIILLLPVTNRGWFLRGCYPLHFIANATRPHLTMKANHLGLTSFAEHQLDPLLNQR